MADITGVPTWVRDPIIASQRALAERGIRVEPDRLLLLLLKRTLSVHGVQAAMPRIEDGIVSAERRKREEHARRLEEQAAAIRRGD